MSRYFEKGFFIGRDPVQRPSCPFCGMPVERPKELKTRRHGEMPVGSCSCGAVYACDVTGHNLGSAFIEALVFGCDMDWDLAWNLFPGEDYLEALVEHYDLDSHLIVPTGSFEGRKVRGVLYFIRLVQDIREVTRQGVQKKLKQATPVSAEIPYEPLTDKPLTRKEIEELVKTYQIEPLLHAAGRDKRILRDLQRLLYSGDKLLRLRTAEILGKTTAVVARKEPGTVSNLLQKLFSSLSNPGSSTWGAIDTIGEIIGNSPDLFVGYIPALYHYLDDEELRPEALKAIARAAAIRPDLIRKTAFRIMSYLGDPNPATRGIAAWIFGFLDMPEVRKELERLRDDPSVVELYENGNIEKKSVGRIAREALEKIGGN
ncbi:MAG: PBS lyase [Firmicutes bacterium]|nr:PBS lyase [Bacillota bacterium]